jgi:2-(1,2-epoxy-1,2-dihydrophenyl)acetyl-CoA isomerase
MFARDLDGMPKVVRESTGIMHMALARLLRLNAPIVACVHGTVMGGALSVVSNCDLVYSSRAARFGAAYSNIGFTCDLGATTGLATRMGLSRARRFLLLGEILNAAEAEHAGLVDFVVDDTELQTLAEQAAVRLSQGPTLVFGEVRRLMARSLSQPLEAQLEDEAQSVARASSAPDAREGITAFIEKRKPVFKGC